jgi:hypothetical protein
MLKECNTNWKQQEIKKNSGDKAMKEVKENKTKK